jgi:hypothetical protein
MTTPKEGKSERFFKDFGKRMDIFLEELKDAGDRAQVDFQKKYEELKKAGENLRKEAQNKERWKEVEAGLKKAGDELEKAFHSAFRKRN